MAHEPNAYPTALPTRGSLFVRPLRGPPALFMRQPDLGSPPKVVSASGFGSGAGAYIRNNGSDADQAQGLVMIHAGLTPAGSGAVILQFASTVTAGQYFVAADWATLNLTAAGQQLTINWTAIQALRSNARMHIAYQWSVSQ